MEQNGLLMVISGPSGTGKGTLVKHLLKRNNNIQLSVSATTRNPRPGEVDEVNYFFMTKNDFEKKLEHGEFLEHAEVYGNYYGTPKAFVEKQLKKGNNVLLEIDILGAMQIREKFKEAVFLFIIPPSLEELQRRIESRGTETPEQMSKRMNSSLEEIKELKKYDYVILNDEVEKATALIEAIINAELASVERSQHYWLNLFGVRR
ncbi:guanylate kinase [Tindallia californiensis]|uniref:Guanylate kinase n=1 Tax=Tindallia californiensis TaxID=159292 RepID=A0A1H3NVL9_9FIRM|nr:guanylate kinase [Tindallia californiensis]SDY92750.1 guanylate kinase [Tindallia californiensis]